MTVPAAVGKTLDPRIALAWNQLCNNKSIIIAQKVKYYQKLPAI
jgi:hypothetical protein